MNLKKLKITSKGLYWGLITTFLILYACVGFVSTLHSITFFELANSTALAVLLGITYEIGQASVLFSILMTKGKEKFLPWALMFLLTALQITANVYASFKFMAKSGSQDYLYWQKSILFGVQASSPEMYQVIISWISGALLPVVALGMTALVAQNIKLMAEENDEVKVDLSDEIPAETAEEIIKNEVERRLNEAKAVQPEPEPIKDEPDLGVEPAEVESILEPEPIQEPIPSTEIVEVGVDKLLPSREEQLTNFKNAVVNNIIGKASPMEERPLIGEGGVQIVRPPVIINIGPETQEEANEEYAKSLEPDVKIGEGGIQVLKDAHSYNAAGNPLEVVEVVQDKKEDKHPLDVYEDQLDEEAAHYMDMQPNVEKSLKAGEIDLLPIMEDLKKQNENNNIPAEDKKAIINAIYAVEQHPAVTISTNPTPSEIPAEVIAETKIESSSPEKDKWKEVFDKVTEKPEATSAEDIKPVNKVQGWHFKKEFIDDDGNVFEKGKYVRTDPKLKKA